MKIKKGFLLRKMAGESVVVAVGEAGKTFNGLIHLNDTGTFYWKLLGNETDKDKLLEAATKEFENFDREKGEKDLDAFLETISVAVEK